jgi:hypothetical protein
MSHILLEAREMITRLQAVCEYRELYCDATDFLEKLDEAIAKIPKPKLFQEVKQYIDTHNFDWYGPGLIAAALDREFTYVNNILRYNDTELGLEYDYRIGSWKKRNSGTLD